MSQLIDELWADAWKVCVGEVDLTGARSGGRKTKDRPNGEDVDQWQVQGPEWVANYIGWREGNPDWKIWKTPQGDPAVELELMPMIGGIPIKMGIDRIFDVSGQLVVVDLKTSQKVPPNPLQLGFYKIGIEQTFGIDIQYGTYYMARTASTSQMVDLSWYTMEKMDYLVEQFDKARKAGIFIPNPDGCGLCGFTKQCQFSSKR